MPAFTVTIKPRGADVITGTATTDFKNPKAGQPKEPNVRKVEVHEGLPSSFDIELAEGERLMLEFETTGQLAYDAAQCMAKVEPKPPAAEPEASPPTSGPQKSGPSPSSHSTASRSKAA